MLALGAFEADICACGFPSSITADRSNFFTFEDRRCNVCARSAQYARVQQAADEAAVKSLGEHAPPATPRPDDGRLTYLRRMSADEVDRRREQREPRGGDRGNKA